MLTTERPAADWKRPARRAGYAVAAAVNVVLLIVVHNLLDWGWPSFLTEDFGRIIPLIDLSLGATALVNVAYMTYDPPRFKGAAQALLGVISLAVAIRTWVVFPFEFTGTDWTWLVRLVLGVSMFGIGIGILTDFTRWVTGR
jgi:hypothetical protein